jgi:hypothetical protein
MCHALLWATAKDVLNDHGGRVTSMGTAETESRKLIAAQLTKHISLELINPSILSTTVMA